MSLSDRIRIVQWQPSTIGLPQKPNFPLIFEVLTEIRLVPEFYNDSFITFKMTVFDMDGVIGLLRSALCNLFRKQERICPVFPSLRVSVFIN